MTTRSLRGRKPSLAASDPSAGSWSKAWIVASILMAVISVRLTELLPLVPRLRPAVVSVGILFPLLLYHSRPRARRRLLRDRTLKIYLLYTLWAALAVPNALWPSAAADGVKNLIIGGTVVMAFVLVAPTKAMLDRLGVVFLGTVAASAALVLSEGTRRGSGRLTTSGAFDPNDFASVLAMAVPFAVALFLREKGKWRIAAGLAAVFIVLALMGTGSRGGMLGLAAGLLVLTAGMKSRRLFKLVLLVALAVPLAWSAAPPVFKDRLASLTSLESDYNLQAKHGRKATWTRGIGYALENPVTGVGLGNFMSAEGEYWRERNEPGRWMTAHNSFIQALAELGFPGGLLFTYLLAYSALVAGRLWRSRTLQRPEYLSALAAFTTCGFFLSHAYAYHLYAMLGLIAHAGYVQRHMSSQKLASKPGNLNSKGRRGGARRPRLSTRMTETPIKTEHGAVRRSVTRPSVQ